MPETLPDFTGLTGQIVESAVTSAGFHELDDAALVAIAESITALRHEVERCQALAAAEVARRSRVALGMQGLAQRTGHPSSGALLQSTTRSSKRDTAALVTVGAMIAEADAAAELARARRVDPGTAGSAAELVPAPVAPWFAELGAAVSTGVLTVAVADAIRSGLGEPGDDADETLLTAELPTLIDECHRVHADAARRAARQVRDRIDDASVRGRAEQQRAAQFWRVWVKPDGMVRGEFELEPEAGMLVKAVFDQLTHPRRTDPGLRRRFGDPARGDTVFADARAARERDAAEGLAQLLRAGVSVDPHRLLNEKKPSVRLVVNASSLGTGAGSGAIEGHPDAIPLGNIHTRLCEGHLPVLFDADGTVLDLGRDERLFTEKQKTALAIRDGGCLDPDCTRPPSWTEAHHIDHWQRDNGRTDLADGILLCRRDHLRYHNQGWEVRRKAGTYWLIPPPNIDPQQTPRPMRSKTPADIINPIDPTQLPPVLPAARERERLPAAG